MSSKLEKLIAFYEAERVSLTAELAECVAEADYKRVYLFSKGLGRINQQLQTLYNLRDKWHDEKEYRAHSIKFLEERVADGETAEYVRRYYTERIAAEKKKLAELTQLPFQNSSVGQVMRDMLGKLLAGELAGFTLVLQDSRRLYCHIRLMRKTLFMTIPEVRRHRADYTLQKSHLRKFRSLGFGLYDTKDKLLLFAPYSTLEEVSAVQRTLARIAFEVFYFKDLTGETFIKYYA
ncbi:MAG: hypothetical protein ACRYFZ_16215 [Janthinobacterium lividum]